MAKLRADLSTNRMGRRGSEVHRLGDTYVEAEIANWEYRLETILNDDGICTVVVRSLQTGGAKTLYNSPIADLYSGTASIELPVVPAIPKPKKRRKTLLEKDMTSWIKEQAS